MIQQSEATRNTQDRLFFRFFSYPFTAYLNDSNHVASLLKFKPIPEWENRPRIGNDSLTSLAISQVNRVLFLD
ncbi:hypothetical protein [Pseudomonas viridiflava]|uniref:hypothetical protein n=1 Tax=Pseudomonas viridiflava TaxID=33069 RepID=UPI001C2D959C|nr:hypothetical protein [Pseudomonas viridiflava]MBV1809847.1 hypothetical protein [Pseudomonas viridiflava]